MKKEKKAGAAQDNKTRPAVDNDQLGENAYEKFSPGGKPDKKSKKS